MIVGSVHSRSIHGLSYVFSPRTGLMSAPLFDVEQRTRKRIYNIWVVESSTSYMRYSQEVGFGSVEEVNAPDPFDVSISTRRWKWLMHEYDQAIKQVLMNHDDEASASAILASTNRQ